MLARRPPMGWNSYNCYGGSVTEAEVRANAAYLAKHLARSGWDTVVIDIAWYTDQNIDDFGDAEIDPYGRLLPHHRRFPSAQGGVGFKPLADEVHALGLRFGVHFMPGLPRQVVARRCPVLGTSQNTGDIIFEHRGNNMLVEQIPFVDVSRPGGQAYYDSIFRLYAEWGVDFVKLDGVGYPYQDDQVAALDLARTRCGRPIILSVSSGWKGDTSYGRHRKSHCEMWRVSDDVWDRWPQIEAMFDNARAWQDYLEPGCWPDLDMLPLGRIGIRQHPLNSPDRACLLTPDEQRTLMTLWCIARAPLFFGGDLPSIDAFTLSLLTNDEVLAVNQKGRRAREAYRDCYHRDIVWTADLLRGTGKAVALFNMEGEKTRLMQVPLEEIQLPHACLVRDLWARQDLNPVSERLAIEVPPHGTRLLRLTPAH